MTGGPRHGGAAADATRRGALAGLLALAAGPARAAQAPYLTLPPTPGLPRPTTSDTVALNGARLFFATFGAGEPVLFLHGGYSSSDHWGHQVAALARTHRVVVMDTRGHGRSPLPPGRFDYALFAADAEALLDHLGIPAAAIVGWSDGGVTGLHLAMTRPGRVRRLFAFGANTRPEGLIPGGAGKPTFRAYAARCRADYARLSPEPGRWPDLAAALRALWRAEPNLSWESVGRIAVPVTVAAARHDEIIRFDHAERIAQAIPGARLVPLPEVSHFAMLQDPGGFTEALKVFLAG